MIDVEPTAAVIDAMAKRLEQWAKDLKRIAGKMRATEDLEYASEAVTAVQNCTNALRLDLLVTRPIRALTQHAKDIEDGLSTGQ